MASPYDDLLNQIQARQAAQQANMLPTERQPLSPGFTDPSDQALQTPALSPEDLIGAGLGAPIASGAMSLGRAMLPSAGAAAEGAGVGSYPAITHMMKEAAEYAPDAASAINNALKKKQDNVGA